MSRSLTVGLGIAGVLAALVGIGEFYRDKFQVAEGCSSTGTDFGCLRWGGKSRFDVHGYSVDGVDISGHTRDYYRCQLLELDQFAIIRAAELSKNCGSLAARNTIQCGIKRSIKLILEHLYGSGFSSKSLAELLSVCERKKIFDQECEAKLYRAVEYLSSEHYASLSEANRQMRYCYLVLREIVGKLSTIVDVDFSPLK